MTRISATSKMMLKIPTCYIFYLVLVCLSRPSLSFSSGNPLRFVVARRPTSWLPHYSEASSSSAEDRESLSSSTPASTNATPSKNNDQNTVSSPPLDRVAQLPLLRARLQDPSLSVEECQDLLWQIDQAETAAELGVRRAQVEFYQAFSTQNLKQMEQVWTMNNDCECIHPGMSSLKGRGDILASWAVIFAGGGAFEIEPMDTKLEICGTTAICRCVEQVGGASDRLEAVNIYKREDGAWKMTMHMASPIVVMERNPPSRPN